MPEGWLDHIQVNVARWRALSERERETLLRDTRVFVAEKHWTPAAGFEITDEARVTIAAQACLLLLGLPEGHDVFPNVREIIVFPSTMSAPVHDGLVAGEARVLGQAHHRGPIRLAWDSVRHGGRNPDDGRNLVYHEFAHALDLLDDFGDGTPPMRSQAQLDEWVRVMTESYDALCESAERGRATLLDAYGCTNPAEFFAVATEVFFEKPTQMRRRHPELYDVLRGYYRQDPASG